MRVRLRLDRGPKVRRKRDLGKRIALAVAELLVPMTLAPLVLAFWRLGADMKWTGSFVIREGIFSHWQVWIAMAAALGACAYLLNRYGRRDDARTP